MRGVGDPVEILLHASHVVALCVEGWAQRRSRDRRIIGELTGAGTIRDRHCLVQRRAGGAEPSEREKSAARDVRAHIESSFSLGLNEHSETRSLAIQGEANAAPR